MLCQIDYDKYILAILKQMVWLESKISELFYKIKFYLKIACYISHGIWNILYYDIKVIRINVNIYKLYRIKR